MVKNIVGKESYGSNAPESQHRDAAGARDVPHGRNRCHGWNRTSGIVRIVAAACSGVMSR